MRPGKGACQYFNVKRPDMRPGEGVISSVYSLDGKRFLEMGSKMSAIRKYRVERWLYLHHLEPLAWFVQCWIYLIHNSFVPYKCSIGAGTEFGYKGIGVVIHSDARIGKECLIGTNVTIGGGAAKSRKAVLEYDALRGSVPVIGDRVHICTGAKVIGDIVIGDDVIIGANAVVIHDVPAKTVVGGFRLKSYVSGQIRK